MKLPRKYKRQRLVRGQTSLETAFVFTMLIFMTFAIMNFSVLFHTKNIATYAAFMAGRSYQVYGDTSGAEQLLEKSAGSGMGRMLSDTKVVAAIQVAEDIFTCSLPWMSVPEGEADERVDPEKAMKDPMVRCQAGKRKYKKLNIGKTLKFTPFKKDQSAGSSGKQDLDIVKGGFAEAGRQPLRYGILNMKYRTPVLFNPMGVYASDGWVKSEVYVPVLLNPGLNTGLTDKKDDDKDFDDDK